MHLPLQNIVSIRKATKLKSIATDPKLHKTKLTEWFEANKNYEDARKLTYCEFPQEWTWDAKIGNGLRDNKNLRLVDCTM